MKSAWVPVLACLLSACVKSTAAEQLKGFRLQVGSSAVELDVGEAVEVTLPGGQKTMVTLTRNPFVKYAADGFSFVHPGTLSVTRSGLGNGIIQHLAVSARGTVVMIQEYAKFNPTSLSQMMLQELTKEAASGGAKITQAPTSRKLHDGKVLVGLVADVKTRSEEVQYEIDAYGVEDRGILAITILRADTAGIEGSILTRFWDSLTLKY